MGALWFYTYVTKRVSINSNGMHCTQFSLECSFHYLLFQDSVAIAMNIREGTKCIYVWLMYVCNPKLSINNEVFLNTKTCSFLLFGQRICSIRICVCFSRTKRIIPFSTNFSSFLPIRRVYKKYNTFHTFQL